MSSAPGRTADRRTVVVRVAAVAVPPVALAMLGLTHPQHLTATDAVRWRDLHVVALFLFPLLGAAPWLVLRLEAPRAAIVAAVLGYAFAACYTALDVLAGIGAGALTVAGRGGQGTLFHMADGIALPGLIAYLAAAALAAAVLLRRDPLRAAGGAALVLTGAVSFLTSHIYPPRGVITMLLLAAGWALLAAVSRPAPR